MLSRLRFALRQLLKSPGCTGLATAANPFPGFNLTGRGGPAPGPALPVSARFFQTLGLSPLLGRALRPEEDRPGGAPVVLISHGFRHADSRVILTFSASRARSVVRPVRSSAYHRPRGQPADV